MTSQLVSLAQVALFLACFGAVVVAISRSAIAGAVLVMAVFLLFEATSPLIIQIQDVQQSIGSVSIYPTDIASFALLLVGVPRLFVLDIRGPARLLLGLLVALLAIHLIWGIAVFGMQHATDSLRDWLPIVSGIVYGATVKSWDRRLPTLFIAAGTILALHSVLSIVRHGLFVANQYIFVNGEFVDARPVIAMGVLVMLEGLILLLSRGTFNALTVGLAGLLASGVVLLQYRTVWVVAFICAVLAFFYLSTRFRATNERTVYFTTGMALLALPFVAYAVAQVGTYQQSVESATGSSSTLTWRLDAWRILVGRHSSALDLLFGTPSGTSREIDVQGVVTNLSAHNVAVEALLLFGVAGPLMLATLWGMAIIYRSETADLLGVGVAGIWLVVVCQILVSMTHRPDQMQGLLLGVMLSAACFSVERSTSAFKAVVGRPEPAHAL